MQVLALTVALLSASYAWSLVPKSGGLHAPEPLRSDTEIRVHLDTIEHGTSSLAARGQVVSGFNLRFPGSLNLDLNGFHAIRILHRENNKSLVDWLVSDRDSGAELAHFQARSMSIAGQNLRLNVRPIPGRLTLWPVRRNSSLLVIAALDLETYVRGVLPSEMPPNWPLEALKAQAVAIRSFALYRRELRTEMAAPYDVEAGISDQVYMVPVFAAGQDHALANVERAVRETEGLLLVTRSESPKVLPSYYHADCGGRTEDAETLWGQASSGTAVDESCPINPQAHWQFDLSTIEVAKALRERLHISERARTVALADLEAIGKTPSGRVSKVRLSWSDGHRDLLSAHDFRMAVGSDKIKSTNFAVTPISPSGAGADRKFHLRGLGYGHGVGMCQWGAKSLAQSGRLYREILKHYYPQSALIQTNNQSASHAIGKANDRSIARQEEM